MKPLFILIFTILYSFKLQAQTKHSLSLGHSYYAELKSIKSFRYTDENSGKYGNGNFISLAYNIEFGKKTRLKLHTSYGYFKRQNFKLNDSTYGNAYSHMVPLKLEGSLNLLHFEKLGLAIFGGLGANWVQYNNETFTNYGLNPEKKIYPMYIYGLAFRLFREHYPYYYIKFTHFDNKDFLSFDLDLPIYKFNKEKKKK